MKRVALSVVLSLIVLSLTSLAASANSVEETFYKGLEVVSVKKEAIEGGDLTTRILKGGENELKALIAEYESKKNGLSAIAPQFNDGQYQTNVNVTGSFSGGVAQCWSDYMYQRCVNGTINAELFLWGATGFNVNGRLATVLVNGEGTGTRSDEQTKPRIQVTVFGLVGGTNVVVQTYDFNPGYASGRSQVYDYDEDRYGIIAYIYVEAGGDFKYKYAGGSYTYTHWGNIVEI